MANDQEDRDTLLRQLLDVIDAEPELPGQVPEELWQLYCEAIRQRDRDRFEYLQRTLVSAIKESLKERIADALLADCESENSSGTLADSRHWREVCRRFRQRGSPEDWAQLAELCEHLGAGRLVAIVPERLAGTPPSGT